MAMCKLSQDIIILTFVIVELAGVLVTGQVQSWQEEDEGEEEHVKPGVRGDAQLRAAAGLAVRADTVAQRVARRHVRPERLPGRGDAAAGRRRVRRPRAHVVQVTRESEYFVFMNSEL